MKKYLPLSFLLFIAAFCQNLNGQHLQASTKNAYRWTTADSNITFVDQDESFRLTIIARNSREKGKKYRVQSFKVNDQTYQLQIRNRAINIADAEGNRIVLYKKDVKRFIWNNHTYKLNYRPWSRLVEILGTNGEVLVSGKLERRRMLITNNQETPSEPLLGMCASRLI